MKIKPALFIALSWLVLASCSGKKANVASETDTDPASVTAGFEALTQEFLPVIQGIWVITDYVDDIGKTKSPLLSSGKFQYISSLFIDNEIQKDHIEVGVSYNNHEGGGFNLYFIPGDHPKSLKTDLEEYDEDGYYELGYETINNENFLFLYRFGKERKLIEKYQYTRVCDTIDDNNSAGYGIQYIVNEKIFTGKYVLLDTNHARTAAEFESNGKLHGFPGFSEYHVQTDFMMDESNINRIFLIKPTGRINQYAFQSEKDTIRLYRIREYESEDREEVEFNKIIYKLIKR